MYISPQERGFDSSSLGQAGLSMGLDGPFGGTDPEDFSSGTFPISGDDIARMLPPTATSSEGNSAGSGVFQSLFAAIGSLFSQMSQMFSGSDAGQNQPFNLGNCTQPGMPAQEQTFQRATASSTGDPHLNFDGTTASGSSVNSRWDNMNGHADLLDSDSFSGGYRISTQPTQPNAQGITYNQDASVGTDHGNVAVELDAQGNATLSRFGHTSALQDGQTVNLGRGESVTRNRDGSLVIEDENQQGATIETTLRDNGSGVDVSVQANNVNLGGYLANTAEGRRGVQPVAAQADAP